MLVDLCLVFAFNCQVIKNIANHILLALQIENIW